ncbi:MAG TPA: hypothetical protein VH438_16860 [Gemmatimonadales bacterium]|jgi:hypothetical protein
MAHIDERTLEQLLNHKMSRLDIDVVLAHAAECRGCGHRLEEWRDHFEEIATLLPDPQSSPQPMALPSAFVLVPDNPAPRHRFDLTNLLWIAAVALALIVGYSASRLQRNTTDGLATSPIGVDPMAEAPQNLAMSRDSLASPSIDTAARIADSVKADTPTARPVKQDSPPATQHTTPPKVAAPAASMGASPKPDASVTMPGFQRVALGEASRRLDGGIRFLSNLSPDHVEVGPGSAVPGAQASLDVVRVVYNIPDGSRILLDQQRIPLDESGFRPINDAALENGDTLFGSSAQGVSVATWVDDDGYRMSLALRAPPDSLRKLIRRVR